MVGRSGHANGESRLPKQLARGTASIAQSAESALHAAGAERDRSPVGKPQDDVNYWQSRAERTRRQAGRYRDPAVRDHFMKIAAGYDELARSARSVREGPETA
jgi:hypothetical protein